MYVSSLIVSINNFKVEAGLLLKAELLAEDSLEIDVGRYEVSS